MKFLIGLCSILLLSCQGHEIDPVITFKSHRTFGGKPMPASICRFAYKDMSNGSWHEFDDSCYKYDVGDKLNKNKK